MNKNVGTVEDLSNEAILWRGIFIHRYAGLEFALTHLLVMASFSKKYAALGPLPYRQSSKLRRLTDLLAMDGPLSPYAGRLREHVRFFVGIEDDRHFIAHGLMVVGVVEDTPICHFRMYQHIEGSAAAGVWDLPLDDLKALTTSIQPHVLGFSNLVTEIGETHLIGR